VTGDFDNDAQPDIVWQHTDGSIALWRMNGIALLSAELFVPSHPSDPRWRVVGANDFDRDGSADLLWQFTDGSLVIWFMNGNTLASTSPTSPLHPGDSHWQVVATGDFNGDSRPDIVWQHDDGWIAVWLMNNAEATDLQLFEPARPSDANWKVVGAGDFNGDGQTDLVWQHQDGTIAVWFMNGTRLIEGKLTVPPNSGPDWRVAGVADYDRDGKPDLLFQHLHGASAVWFMDEVKLTRAAFTEPNNSGDPTWKIVGPK
jgi:hypothetical protein